jgi:hypothetical protein
MQAEFTVHPTAVQRGLREAAQTHGFSEEAVSALWAAMLHGGGSMAQFSHPELGGHGQWMRSGMVMVGDMFNRPLAARIGALGATLAQLHAELPAEEPPRRPADAWWPPELSQPATAGAQNGMRYAWFPVQRRLVIERDGEQAIYDTADHAIGGVAQQQGTSRSLRFTSQHGPLTLDALQLLDVGTVGMPSPGHARTPSMPVPAADGSFQSHQARAPSNAPADQPLEEAGRVGDDVLAQRTWDETTAISPAPARPGPRRTAASVGQRAVPPGPPGASAAVTPEQIIATLEQLAGLRDRGILSAGEFQQKKAELLSRL